MLIICDSDITELIKSLYGICASNIDRLDGYEDVNIKFRPNVHISDMTNIGHSDYVLKLATQTTACLIGLQHKLMRYLYDNGIPTCKPVYNLQGETICTTSIQLEDQKEVDVQAHVLTFVPGQTMADAGTPLSVLESVGKLAGQVDSLLNKFGEDWSNHTFGTLWQLSAAPAIGELLHDYCNNVQRLGQEVINAYKKQVEPVLDEFQKGLIHGDMNNCNILVKSVNTTTSVANYEVCGVIDYGDVCYSYYVYDIATLMADLMSSTWSQQTCPLNVARLILHGYKQEFELQQNELERLRIVICVRCLQYYVLSGVSLRKDPNNVYAGRDRDLYLMLAKYLWSLDEIKFRQSVWV